MNVEREILNHRMLVHPHIIRFREVEPTQPVYRPTSCVLSETTFRLRQDEAQWQWLIKGHRQKTC